MSKGNIEKSRNKEKDKRNKKLNAKYNEEDEDIDTGAGNAYVNPLKNEVIGIIITSFGVLMAIFMLSEKAGNVGNVIKDFFLGVFGVGAYLMPCIVFIYGIVVIKNKRSIINKKRIMWFMMVIVSFVGLDHIFYQHFSNIPWEYNFSAIYNSGLHGYGGGIIGGYIAITLYKMFYIYGAIIASITAFTIFTMLAADVSILLGIGRIIKFFIKMKKKRQLIKNEQTGAEDEFDEEVLENIKSNKKDTIINLNKSKINLINLKDYKNEEVSKELESFKQEDEKLEQKINIVSSLQKAEEINSKSDLKAINELKAKDDTKNQNEYNIDLEFEPKKKKRNKESVGQLDISYENSEENARNYILPDVDILNVSHKKSDVNENKELLQTAKVLEETLESFGVSAKVLQVSKGPTVTRYELQPNHGVKVSRIVNLSDDIALNLAAATVRIEAPIPGKSAVGIEIPNRELQGVYLREVIQTKEFLNSKAKLAFAVGMNIDGTPIVADIAKMPHLLIAGSTGSGKSVCINTLIASVLYKSSPDEVKIIMVDPKVVELNVYNGIPHLMIPVVTDPKKAAAALNWAVQEMLKRYNLFAETGTRDIGGYNNYIKDKAKLEQGADEENTVPLAPLPQILIIIDELADLMMAAANEVEDAICRLAQMARAAGMHLVIATQRPSVDVITGVIKANIPSRIAFAVSSQVDSRTILDMSGAEKLLGKGDMLFYPIGNSKPVRVQGPFISDKEVEKLVDFIKKQNTVNYDEKVIDEIESASESFESTDGVLEDDELLPQAINIVIETQTASISMLQRRLRVGFSRAARLIDQMEAKNIVGPPEGSKPRRVILTKSEYEQIRMAED